MAAPRRVAVAASAGRDSTALLHCTVRAAAPLGIEVVALHVHHGLMADADTWLRQVRGQARRWGAAFDCRRLAGNPGPGESVEAWARAGRYQALAEMAAAAGCPLVLMAHHRRDQAETWLLQGLRGAGPAGLSAMPVQARRGAIEWVRPWLAQPREAIEAYVRRHRLRHADDPSNDEYRLARGRLRREVWPALAAAFPHAERALAAAAARAQQAARLAEEVAALDAPGVLDGSALRIPPWSGLPPARRRNLLRAWLADATGHLPPETLLARLDRELPLPEAHRWPAPGGELRRHRARLHFVASMPGAGATAHSLDLSEPGDWELPAWQGHLEVRPVERGGIATALLRDASVRPRQGGEQFRLAPKASARSLKKQFQALAVPVWARHGPLVYAADGRLVFVPGLGIDAACRAAAGEAQCTLRWVPMPAVATGRRQSGR